MKKKLLNSMRVLLVAAGLCVGVNSTWATDVTVNETDKFNYSSGTCLNASYTDAGSTAKDAIGIISEGSGNRYSTLTFGTTVTYNQVLLTTNILISAGNNSAGSSYFRALDQSSSELFTFRIDNSSGSSNVKFTDSQGLSVDNTISTTSTKDDTFGGNAYYKTKWTEVKAYLDFEHHTGWVKVGSKVYDITLAETSTGVKGFALQGGRQYGAALVAKDYSAVEAPSRFDAGFDTFSLGNGSEYNADYTDSKSVTKSAIGVRTNGGSGSRYATLTLGSILTYAYAKMSANIVLQSGNNDSHASYVKLLDQSGDELFSLRMTGNNTTDVKLTYSGNSDGTSVMTATKVADALGNGSSSYGNTGWVAISAYLNFVDHNGVISVNGTEYEIALPETSTGIKGFYLQSAYGYGASLLATDYSFEKSAAPAGAVTIKYVDEEDNEIAEGTALSVIGKLAGDVVKYTYSKYLADGGDLYVTTASKTNATVTLTDEAQEVKVVYEKSAEGIYYFYEKDGGYTTRADNESNGSAATYNASITVPYDGIYQVTANCYGSASNRTAYVYVGEDKEENRIVASTTIGIYAPGTNLVSEEVALSAGDVVSVHTSDSKSGIDYIILKRKSVPVTVSAVGYATLCPSANLNFSSATEIEACKASVDASGKITYTVVNTVKAGEGVLLRSKSGGEATETIPVLADATLNEDNAFVGIPEKVKLAQVTETGYTNYILSMVDAVLGFYKVNDNGSWCNAGTAYLKVADSSAPARGFFTLWNDEATGINAVTGSKAAEGQTYNLNGQRVAEPAKGLYIVNGKKVIIK